MHDVRSKGVGIMARKKGSKNKAKESSIVKETKDEADDLLKLGLITEDEHSNISKLTDEPESKLRIVKVYATEETRLSNGVMKIAGKVKADNTFSNNSKFFLQNHPRNVLVSQFSIHCKYIADPFNIDLEVINEVQYDAYIIEIGDHIADLIII